MLRTYLTEFQCRILLMVVTNRRNAEGMVLQIHSIDANRIQVTDGMNTAYLNLSREQATVEALCKKINRSAQIRDAMNSIFVFYDFAFEFDWDCTNLRLMVGVDCDTFDFLHPGVLHERTARVKNISAVLGIDERESLKRQALKKKLKDQPVENIDMNEMLGIVSTGGVLFEGDLKAVLKPEPAVDPQEAGNGDYSTAPIDRCLMRDGWLTFPFLEETRFPSAGGVFETLDSFLNSCKIVNHPPSQRKIRHYQRDRGGKGIRSSCQESHCGARSTKTTIQQLFKQGEHQSFVQQFQDVSPISEPAHRKTSSQEKRRRHLHAKQGHVSNKTNSKSV